MIKYEEQLTATNATTTTDGPSLREMVELVKSLRVSSPPPRIEPCWFVPKYGRKWQFPHDRFVEYEESDERWAVPLGFGRYVDDESQLVAWRVDWSYLQPFGFSPGSVVGCEPVVYVHPEVLAALEGKE